MNFTYFSIINNSGQLKETSSTSLYCIIPIPPDVTENVMKCVNETLYKNNRGECRAAATSKMECFVIIVNG